MASGDVIFETTAGLSVIDINYVRTGTYAVTNTINLGKGVGTGSSYAAISAEIALSGNANNNDPTLESPSVLDPNKKYNIRITEV